MLSSFRARSGFEFEPGSVVTEAMAQSPGANFLHDDVQ